MVAVPDFRVGEIPSREECDRRGIVPSGVLGGLTFEQSLANRPDECARLADSTDARPEFAGLVAWLKKDDRLARKRRRDELDALEDDRGRTVLFGKHYKTKTFGELYDNHPFYCLALYENTYEKVVAAEHRKFLTFIRDNGGAAPLQEKIDDLKRARRQSAETSRETADLSDAGDDITASQTAPEDQEAGGVPLPAP